MLSAGKDVHKKLGVNYGLQNVRMILSKLSLRAYVRLTRTMVYMTLIG